jgi:hypothetical protein
MQIQRLKVKRKSGAMMSLVETMNGGGRSYYNRDICNSYEYYWTTGEEDEECNCEC